MSEQYPAGGQAGERPVPAAPETGAPAAAPGAVPDSAAPNGAAPAQDGVPQGAGGPAGTAPPRQHVLRRTRFGGLWVALALSAVILLLLLIFILENGKKASVAFFGAHASVPLGVGLLLAAVFGALIVIIPGTGRIIQLRVTARRHRRQDTKRATAGTAPPAGPGPAA